MTFVGLRSVSVAMVLWAATAWAWAAPASAGAVELEARGDRPTPTRAVLVPVDVRKPAGLGALEVEVVYDSEALEFTSIESDALLESALLEHQVLEPGRVRCALISSEPIEEDGTLFVVRFQARVTKGTTDLTLEQVMAWDHENVLEMLVHADGSTLDLTPGGPDLPVGWIAAAAAVGLVLLVLACRRGRRRPEPVYPGETQR